MPRHEDAHLANRSLRSSTTPATLNSLSTSKEMRPFLGASGSSSRMPPQPLRPAVPDGGPSQSGIIAVQQQQQMAGYPTQQYQSQTQTHWYASSAQPTSTPVPQPSQGYPTTFAGPSHGNFAYHARGPTRIPSMYAAHIPGGSTQGQQYYSTRIAAHSQTTQANQQPACTSPTHLAGIYQVHPPTVSSGSGSGPAARRTPPMAPVSIPPSVSVSPVTCPPSSGSEAGAARPFAPVSAVGSQIPHGDSSTKGQKYSSAPAGYPQLQLYSRQLYTSTRDAAPAEVVPLANDPFSYTSPHSPQANLTASGVTPNSRAGPSGANISIGRARTVGEPASSNQQIGPSRRDRTNRQQESKPYKRPAPTIRKTRPITFEGNLVRLQRRCRNQGADDDAIELLGKIFADEISLEALTRPLTDGEAETKEFGIESGMIYTALLEHPDEENGGYTCRMCHSEQTWKRHRDVLRHLKRDHFAISDDCDRCMKKFYTKSEKKKHSCQ